MHETTVSQKIIPVLPERIPLYTCSPNEANKAVSRILQAAAKYDKAYLSLAVKRTRKGDIDSLALATSREVVIIKLNDSPASKKNQLLITLLAGPTFGQTGQLTLVAFGMAPIAIQLSGWAVNSPVVGIDLSTSVTVEGDAKSPSCPSKLISRVSAAVHKSRVDALWATSCNTETSKTLCLRAWITAWYAIFPPFYEDDLNPRGNSQYCREPRH